MRMLPFIGTPVENRNILSEKDANLCFLTPHLTLLNVGNKEMLSSPWYNFPCKLASVTILFCANGGNSSWTLWPVTCKRPRNMRPFIQDMSETAESRGKGEWLAEPDQHGFKKRASPCPSIWISRASHFRIINTLNRMQIILPLPTHWTFPFCWWDPRARRFNTPGILSPLTVLLLLVRGLYQLTYLLQLFLSQLLQNKTLISLSFTRSQVTDLERKIPVLTGELVC